MFKPLSLCCFLIECISPAVGAARTRKVNPMMNTPTIGLLTALGTMDFATAVATDSLVFSNTERDPRSENLRLRMEALDYLEPDEQDLVIAMIEGGFVRHHARQLDVS